MPSSTALTGPGGSWGDALRDAGHLIAFRAGTVRRRGTAALGAGLVLVLTVLFAVGPGDVDAGGAVGDITGEAYRALLD